MHRRDTLRRCATLGAVGVLGALAGCSGGSDQTDDESEESSLSVAKFDYEEGEDGNLVITVTVENSGDSSGTGTLYVTVTAAETTSSDGGGDDDGGDGDDDTVAARESTDVTVPAGETKTVRLPFDLTIGQFQRNGSLDVDLRT